MLWLAGLLGLVAVGGLAISFDETAPAEDESDSTGDATGEIDITELPNILDGFGAFDGLGGSSAPSVTSIDTDGVVLPGGDGGDTLTGGDGVDQINGYDGDDLLEGGAGDDDLHGSDGADTLMGGEDDDVLHGEHGDDVLAGQSGDDTLFGHNDADRLLGGDGDDSLNGGMGADTLAGDAGDDALHGGLDNDRLDGGTGQDSLFGGWGDDHLTGIEALGETDYLNGGGGGDTIVAGAGDIVTGGSEGDSIVLGHWIAGRGPAEVMDFERGEDQIVLIWDLGASPNPEIEILRDDSGTGLTHVFADGAEIARFHGASAPGLGDIVLIDATEAVDLGLTAA